MQNCIFFGSLSKNSTMEMRVFTSCKKEKAKNLEFWKGTIRTGISTNVITNNMY